MRLCLILLAAWLGAGLGARAGEQLMEEFDGHNSLTTSDFQVPNGWEIRWNSEQVLSIGVIRLDNTVVAGATGHDMGSLFVPQGGIYRIRVRGVDPIPWDVKVYALGPVAPIDDGAEITFYEPTPGPDYKPPPPVPVPVVKPVAAPVVTAAPAPPPTQLSADQLRCLVTVKGDRTQGVGFFLKTGNGTVVITTQGLLADNPNLELATATGAPLTVTKIQGATDRNVALVSVKDFGYPALDPGDPAAVQPGDAVLTIGADGTPYAPQPVELVGPHRLTASLLHAQIGAPVILAKTGKVIGVVSAPSPAVSIENFEEENFDDRETHRADAAVPVVLRFDTVPGFETYQWNRWQNQTLFLDNFRENTRDLDSYLNGATEGKSKLWQGNDKIKSANSSFLMDTPAGDDPGERIEALHSLLFELGLVADTGMDQIALPGNFYVYEKRRAQEEMAYRQALKAQITSYGDNVHHFNHVVIRNN